jgi:uncharacterized membrane protein
MEFRFNPAWPWWLTALLAIALLAFAIWTYPPATPRRGLLLTLRFGAIAVALFAFVRPALEFKRIIEQSSTMYIAYDRTRSMTLQDMWRNLSRWDALRELRTDADPHLLELAKKVRLKELTFDRKLADRDQANWNEKVEGRQTGIGNALAEIIDQNGDERVAGILLLSDGVNNTGIDPSEIRTQLSARNIPVHCFGFGSETATDSVRDLMPLKIDVSPTAFKRNRLPVRAEFQTTGFAGRKIPVSLKFDGKEAGKGTLESFGDGQRGTVEIVGIPEQAGDVKVTLEVEPQPGELLVNNNAISTYVSVRADGLGVLHIEGKYRFWEPKFIRRSIDQSPDIDLTQIFLLDDTGRPNELPENVLQPGRFDVVILGDVPATRLGQEQIAKLTRMLDSGTGLIMIGGYESFGPGGWGQSPLAKYLPVEMNLGDPQFKKEFRMVPSAAGLRHFVLRLAPDINANAKIWETLRPLDGGNSWTGLKPNALILAESSDKHPLLVAQEIGKSRILAFAADTTWRWATKNLDGKTQHAKFWRQLILWLAHREDSAGNQIRIRLDRRRLALGEKLPVEVLLESKDGRLPEGVTIKGTVRGIADDTSKPVSFQRQTGSYSTSVSDLDKPGDYEISVSVTQNGKELGTASAKFLVFDDDLEMRQLAADFESLKRLSADTGGEYLSAEQFPKFVKSLLDRNLNQEVTKPVIENLWDRWEPLLLFVMLLGAEWLLRKRNGLV